MLLSKTNNSHKSTFKTLAIRLAVVIVVSQMPLSIEATSLVLLVMTGGRIILSVSLQAEGAAIHYSIILIYAKIVFQIASVISCDNS